MRALRFLPLVSLLWTPPAHLTADFYSCNYERRGVAVAPPELPAGAPEEWLLPYHATYNRLCYNLKGPNQFFRGHRGHPGPPYKAAYLWDTAFIAQVWSHWDTNIAQELMKYIFRFQKKSGKIHHAVLELVVKPLPYKDSQPPVLAWATWQIYQKSLDRTFLEKSYGHLVRFHDWWKRNRRHPDGLYYWTHPYESGIDNSPRFSNRDESVFYNTRVLASVDIVSYQVMSLETLASIARELGKVDEADQFLAERAELVSKANELLWDEVDGNYYDWSYREKAFVRENTIASLMPLAAGIATPAQAERLLARVRDPKEYNTLIPFPSVARNHQSFVKDMWRGPVWINTAYLGVLGVERYAGRREAAHYARRIIEGVYGTYENEGYFYEFYDPDRLDIRQLHRKKGNWWKALTLGTKPVKNFVGWTGLVNSLVHEYADEW
jgi:glycogen debranching enzyme